MAASILYYTFLASPRKLLFFTICKEGSHDFRLEKVSVAMPCKIYVSSLEMSYKPIGREETKIEICGSAI